VALAIFLKLQLKTPEVMSMKSKPSIVRLPTKSLAAGFAGTTIKRPPLNVSAQTLQFVAMLKHGLALENDGKIAEAEQIYSAVLERDPNNADAHYRMGMLARHVKATGLAMDHLRKALRGGAGYAHVQYGYGLACLDHGLAAEALKHIDLALKLKPGVEQILTTRAITLQRLGKHEAAATLAKELFTKNPASIEGMTIYAMSHKFKGNEPEIEMLDHVIMREDLGEEPKRRLGYALGKMYNDAHQYDKAFGYFSLAADTFDKDITAQTAAKSFDEFRSLFSQDFFAKMKKGGNPSEKPVFIVGMPRSGTTLTEQILASHPKVFGAGELLAMKHIARRLGYERGGIDELRESMEKLTEEQRIILGQNYLNTIEKYNSTVDRCVDKMPHNFLHLGLIAYILPNAKIIHCYRDPMDNCVSCFTSPLNEGHSYAKNLATLGAYYRQYWSLMAHWKSVLPIKIHDMPYEATVADLETRARGLIDYIGLEWNDACLKFNEADRQVATISNWQVRQPLYKTSVKRWKVYENHLAPLIDALGDLAVVD
jgi:tetratricopeptide (TPR) repeat protein